MTLDVLLHGERVGVLTQDPSTNVVSFTLSESYLGDAHRSVLGQVFENRRRIQQFRRPKPAGYLPHFFANVMPEGALELIVEHQFPGLTRIELLSRIGGDLPGAVTVRQSEAMKGSLDERQIFDEREHVRHSESAVWRFSLAGVQLKMSALRGAGDRFTLPVSNADGRWIVKLGAGEYASLPENEFAVMRWAQRAGLNVPEHSLIDRSQIDIDVDRDDAGETAFVIERYDRTDAGRVHQEDFAQALGVPPESKYDHATYESLAWMVGDRCGVEDLREFMRRVVFMVLSGNVDAHLKNWSLVYPDRRTPRLAPAYDLVFVTFYPRIERRLALKLAGEKVPAAIQWRHLERVERFLRDKGLDAPIVDDARAFVRHAMEAWDSMRDEVAPVSLREALSAHLTSLPLIRG